MEQPTRWRGIVFAWMKPEGQRTGLGLAISYGIIKNHGGESRVNSIEGKGTTFLVEFPPCAEGVNASSEENPGG